MSDTLIKVTGLGKKYKLGMTINHDTLRDQMRHTAKRIYNKLIGKNGNVTFPNSSEGVIGSNQHSKHSEFWALKNVNFEVKRGDILGVIGHNGAGKSTLLKILSKITEPSAGEIRLRGRVGSLLEVGTGMHPELSGKENVYLNGAILGMGKNEINRKYDQIVNFAGIEEFMATPIKRYSSGMRVRLGFSIAAHLETEILLIDEVLSVGDMSFQRKCLGKMESFTSHGRAVIFVSHNMAAIQGLCSRACLMDKGSIIADGSTDQLIQEYLKRQAENTTIPIDQRRDRKGNGKIRFTQVTFKSANNSIIKHSISGETLKIAVEYSSYNKINLKDLVIHISFYNSTGQFMFTCASDSSGYHFTEMTPKGCVTCKITKLPLAQGEYTFNLYSTVQGRLSDWIINAGSLSVAEGDFFGTGKLSTHKEGFLVENSWEKNHL